MTTSERLGFLSKLIRIAVLRDFASGNHCECIPNFAIAFGNAFHAFFSLRPIISALEKVSSISSGSDLPSTSLPGGFFAL